MSASEACVYLSEEALPLPLSPWLYSEAESSQVDSEKQSALSKGTRLGDQRELNSQNCFVPGNGCPFLFFSIVKVYLFTYLITTGAVEKRWYCKACKPGKICRRICIRCPKNEPCRRSLDEKDVFDQPLEVQGSFIYQNLFATFVMFAYNSIRTHESILFAIVKTLILISFFLYCWSLFIYLIATGAVEKRGHYCKACKLGKTCPKICIPCPNGKPCWRSMDEDVLEQPSEVQGSFFSYNICHFCI
jgi:hypothetical protein